MGKKQSNVWTMPRSPSAWIAEQASRYAFFLGGSCYGSRA